MTQRKGLLWDVRRTWFAQPGRAHLMTGQLSPTSLFPLSPPEWVRGWGWAEGVFGHFWVSHMMRLTTGKGRGHSWECKLWSNHTLYLPRLCFIIMAVFAHSANQCCSKNGCSCVGFSFSVFSLVMEVGTSRPGAKQGRVPSWRPHLILNSLQISKTSRTTQCGPQISLMHNCQMSSLPWCTLKAWH